MTEATVDREIPKPEQKKQLPAVLPAEAPQQFLTRGYSQEQWEVLSRSFFPNAQSAESIMLVTSYCAARKLDLMTKPYHIVPAYNSKTGRYEDGIWPSVTLYEITAHRTGEWAGIDEAVYGPEKEFSYSGWKKKLPEYCTVTVYRVVKGKKEAFTSERIYFEEFVAFENNGQPNKNWGKKPRFMMAKCAKAAALRMAFPEEIGSLPTAEEMEGQTVGEVSVHVENQVRAKAIAETRQGEVIEGEVVEPTQQERLQAAAETNAMRGNGEAAEMIREAAAELEKITASDSLKLMREAGKRGKDGKDVFKLIGEVLPHLAGNSNWVQVITRPEFEKVLAEVTK